MDIFLSAALGSVLKIYDDITDNNIQLSFTVMELLKSFIICIFTWLAKDDFTFALVTLLTLLGSYCVGGIDVPFWEAFIYISFFMLFVSKRINGSIIQQSVLIFFTLIGVIGESLLFPEEASTVKTISRIVISIGLILLHFVNFFNVPFFAKICVFAASYFLTSIAIRHLFNTHIAGAGAAGEKKLKSAVNKIEAHTTPSISIPIQAAPSKNELHPPPQRADLPGAEDEGRESHPCSVGK